MLPRHTFFVNVGSMTPERARVMAEQLREDLATEAAEAHLYLEQLGVSREDGDGKRLSLKERIRSMAHTDGGRCPHCGSRIVVTETFPGWYQAVCSNCYDGAEDAGPIERCMAEGQYKDRLIGEFVAVMETLLAEAGEEPVV